MKLYRIAPRRYLKDFTGKGASYQHGARWNLPGQPVLYFGTSAAVAMLEMGNYIPNPKMVPKSYVLGIYETTSQAVETITIDNMPENWDSYPYPSCSQKLGSRFLEQNNQLILLVPSAAAGGLDSIAVVNPAHSDISTLRLVDTKTQIYNPRLFQGIGK